MKPILVIGLGNVLMGDDGIGAEIARRLAADPRLPAGVEVIEGGTDLLRYAGQMQGRSQVVIVDALLDPGEPPGTLQRWESLDESESNAHQLSAVQAIKLLQCAWPALAMRFTFIGIAVSSARFGGELSPELRKKLPEIAERVLTQSVARTPVQG